jgi:hypothetical protein
MIHILSIERAFCGPPDSANGGYVCGRLAGFIEGPALVRLEAPPPLDVEMEVRPADDGFEMVDGEKVIATVKPAQLTLDVPAPPSYEDAESASRSYTGLKTHFFPTCFVCGPYRKAGEGLRIFPGRLAGTNLVAAPWVPHQALGNAEGKVSAEFLWAALDCPGAFACAIPAKTPVLLGEMSAALTGDVQVGERCVVVGWEIGGEGRKHHTGTALYSESGVCRGIARATWFEMPARRPKKITQALAEKMGIDPAAAAHGERPPWITPIAWILIVTAVVSSILSTLSLAHPVVQEMMNRNPLPLPFQYALLYGAALAQLVSGVAILHGQELGRILYTVCGAISLLVGVITTPITLVIIPSILFYAVVVVFLFLPKSHAYFQAIRAGGTETVA